MLAEHKLVEQRLRYAAGQVLRRVQDCTVARADSSPLLDIDPSYYSAVAAAAVAISHVWAVLACMPGHVGPQLELGNVEQLQLEAES